MYIDGLQFLFKEMCNVPCRKVFAKYGNNIGIITFKTSSIMIFSLMCNQSAKSCTSKTCLFLMASCPKPFIQVVPKIGHTGEACVVMLSFSHAVRIVRNSHGLTVNPSLGVSSLTSVWCHSLFQGHSGYTQHGRSDESLPSLNTGAG